MRNIDTSAAEVPGSDGEPENVGDPAGRRCRRSRVIVGAAGLVAVLGAGIWAVAHDGNGEPAHDEAAPASSSRTSSVAGTAEPEAAKAEEVRSLMEAANVPRSVAEKWVAARAADDEPGSTVRRPLAGLSEATASDADVRAKTVGKIRVTSARQDLAGQRELAWVADEGEPVGDARCSQTFRLSRDVAAKERPTLLVCWRVSEARSVYTVVIDRKNRPSKQNSVAQIDRTWARLGGSTR